MLRDRSKLYRLTVIAVFCAIVVVMQCTLGVVTIGPVNLNFVLIPILVAGMLFGKAAGALAGTAFGIATFIQCITGTQAFGSILLNINWFYCFVMVVARGALVGFVPALLYQALKKCVSNKVLRSVICSAIAPVLNTGLFILCFAVFYNAKMSEMVSEAGVTSLYFLFIAIPGINFILEFASSVLITPPVTVALDKSTEAKTVQNGEQ